MRARRALLVVAGVVGAWTALAAQARPGALLPGEPGRPVERDDTVVTTLWHVAGAGRGTPAVDATRVYVQSAAGELMALDRETGAVRWRRRTSPPGLATGGSSVRLWEGLVIAGDEDLVAFDAETGEPAWRFAPADGYGVGHYLGAISSGTVFAGSPSGRLYAVDAGTGRLRWSTEPMATGPVTVYEPLAADGLVVAGYIVFTAPVTGGVIAVGAADGRVRWRHALSSHDGSAFTHGYGNGLLVEDGSVLASGRDGTLHALNWFDGSPLWSVRPVDDACVTGAGRPDHRPLGRSGRLVVSGSSTGCVVAIDLDSRALKWRYTDPRLGSTSFRIASDRRLVYVPFLSGRLVALDADSGVERWRVGDNAREFTWAPVLGDRQLYLTSPAGYFAYSR